MSSSSGGGMLSASLMFIPLLAVPFLAAFGLPQFSPVAASSSDAPAAASAPSRDPGVGEGKHYTRNDLFLPFDEPSGAAGGPAPATEKPPVDGAGGQTAAWTDPFQSATEPQSAAPSTDNGPRSAANAPPDGSGTTRPVVQPSAFEFGQPAPSSGAFDEPPGEAFAFDPSPQASVPPGVPPSEPAPRGPAGGGSDVPLTWAGVVQRLNDLGIYDFGFEPGRDESKFLFACVYSPPDQKHLKYRFESEKNDPKEAIADVLRQIDQRLARR